MELFDMHIHSFNDGTDPKILLRKMEEAGIYGGCVFSNRPDREHITGTSFDERLNEVLSITKGYEDRLFPVLWIHPFEDDIFKKLQIAADSGIAAFKIICNDFYASDPRCLEVLKEIARLNKPVIFHTGILWDGRPTSEYNRPLHFEALINIKGLRFALCHCSWPWIDECIALYGKFLNALNTRDDTAEMFFDITPGTPEIYRRELLTKLYTIGYDVGDNVLFGTDQLSADYRPDWTAKWLSLDGKILDELGVSALNRQKLYHDNLMRFLGKTCDKVAKNAPDINDDKPWSPVNPNVKTVIEKWYKKLDFSPVYDAEFYEILNDVKIPDTVSIDNYNLDCKDGKRNFLSVLYMCERLEDFYKRHSLPEDVLLDTLGDIKVWTRTWSNVKGCLYLGQLGWLCLHLSGKLFKLGRLQFCMDSFPVDLPEYGLKKGDDVVAIHIPKGGKLDIDECKKSMKLAKEFFEKYFDYSFEYFTCHSWLLDDTLKKYLPEKSNIVLFGNQFEKISSEKDDAILRYVFAWNTNSENISDAPCNSSFAQSVKRAYLGGETFYSTLGIIKK